MVYVEVESLIGVVLEGVTVLVVVVVLGGILVVVDVVQGGVVEQPGFTVTGLLQISHGQTPCT